MWACPSCTLEQSDRRTTCRLCDTLRPDVAIRQAALLNPPKKKKAIRPGSTVKKQAVGNKRQALQQEVAPPATLLTAEPASAVTASSSSGVALHTNTPNRSSVDVHTVALTDGESSSDSEPSEDECSYVPQVLMKAVGKAARVRSRQIPGLPLLPDVLLSLPCPASFCMHSQEERRIGTSVGFGIALYPTKNLSVKSHLFLRPPDVAATTMSKEVPIGPSHQAEVPTWDEHGAMADDIQGTAGRGDVLILDSLGESQSSSNATQRANARELAEFREHQAKRAAKAAAREAKKKAKMKRA